MKLLITGGAGYVGSALLRRLSVREDIDEIIIYDNLSRSRSALLAPLPGGRCHIRLVRADLLDTRRLSKALDGVEQVVHLAARVTRETGSGLPRGPRPLLSHAVPDGGVLDDHTAVRVFEGREGVYGGFEAVRIVLDDR